MKLSNKVSLKISVSSVYSVVRKTFYILLFMFYIIIVNSCDSNEISTGSISGVVSLENNDDASGVYVAVYDLAELDPVIVEANNTWNHIGVIIDQKTEFDHRLQTPVKYTQTDATGSYELKDIANGKYNIVFYKAGWGFKYLLNYEIAKGENTVNNVELYEENIYAGYIRADSLMLSDHHYIIENNENIVPGEKQIIEPGLVV